MNSGLAFVIVQIYTHLLSLLCALSSCLVVCVILLPRLSRLRVRRPIFLMLNPLVIQLVCFSLNCLRLAGDSSTLLLLLFLLKGASCSVSTTVLFLPSGPRAMTTPCLIGHVLVARIETISRAHVRPSAVLCYF